MMTMNWAAAMRARPFQRRDARVVLISLSLSAWLPLVGSELSVVVGSARRAGPFEGLEPRADV